MSILSLIANGFIKIENFTAEQRLVVIGLLTTLYTVPAAAAIFDELTDINKQSLPLTIIPGGPSADIELNLVKMDLNFNQFHVNNFGQKVQFSLASVLMHEVIHAILGQLDTVDILNGTTGNPDYKGDTVTTTNAIMAVLGEQPRISYGSTVYLGLENILGPELTFGNHVDVVLFTSSGEIDSDSGTTLPGPSPSTDLNSYNLADLIIDGEYGNNFSIKTGFGNDFIYGLYGNDTIDSGGNDDSVFGGTGDDSVLGGVGRDRLDGGLGVDFLDGGTGDDTIYFGSEDSEIVGGDGFDVGYLGDFVAITGTTIGFEPHSAGISIDLQETELECVIGGTGIDNFITDSSSVTLLAGGAGNDTFNITINKGSPTIVWGGDGSDTISFSYGSGSPIYGQTGILVVNVDGLTQENFHLFDIEKLGLANNFAWDKIDVVVINPDSSDKLLFNGGTSGVVAYEDERYIPFSQQVFVNSPNGGLSYFGKEGFLPVSFLGSYTGLVQAAWSDADTEAYVLQTDGNGNQFLDTEIYPNTDGTWTSASSGRILDIGEAFYLGNFLGPDPSGGYTPGSQLVTWNFGFVDRTASEMQSLAPWFVVGGQISGTVLSGNSSISYTMPAPETGNGGGPGGGSNPPPPRGGTYTKPSSVTNLVGEEGTQRLTGFDATKDSVVINGVALSAASLAVGMIAYEANGSTVINYGEDDNIVLRGVTLSTWQAGAAAQIRGGAGADNLSGTSGADVFAGGGGADTITAGAGDDWINYSSGNDIIIGDTTQNLGVDTLDLRRFAATDVRFAISGSDVTITTADGTITLGSQVLNDLGSNQSNIEAVLFGITTFNEASIRSRALSDQATLGNDSVFGTAFADYIAGSLGNDSLFAGAGNDTLNGGGGDDSLFGGAGTDTAIFAGVFSSFAVSSVSGGLLISNGAQGTDFVSSDIENLSFSDGIRTLASLAAIVDGTSGNDLINLGFVDAQGHFVHDSTLPADTIFGYDGNDTIFGYAGNDALFGGNGNDSLDGGAGADVLVGGAGNDVYVVDSFADVITEIASEGTDTVETALSFFLASNIENLTLIGTASVSATGNTLGNILTGNAGVNLLSGLDGADMLRGGIGNDTLDGGTGIDSLSGGAGDDLYIVDETSDATFELASEGVDLVQASVTYTLTNEMENLTLTGTAAINGVGNTAANVMTGNTAANLLSGLVGNDTIVAGSGNDTLDGGAGNDSLTGGLGDDVYVVGDGGDVVIEAASGGTDTVESGISFVLATNFENLTLTGAAIINGTGNTAANALTGNSAANLLSASDGNDTLNGGAGNDTLNGEAGADSMIGGLGDDTFIVDAISEVTVESASEGTDMIQSSISWTLSSNIENLTLVGTAGLSGNGNVDANTITGTSGANVLAGLDGADTLIGAAGNDTLDGGAGVDSLVGGMGNDVFIIDTSFDVISELVGDGIDLAQASISYTLASEVENLTLIGTAAINGTGNTLANILTGNGAANLLAGLVGNDAINAGDGNDTLDGGAGNDSLTGGLGDDTYVVSDVGDLVVEAISSGTDAVQSSVTFTLAVNVENLTLSGTSAINGTGNVLANILKGNTAANNLSGLDGDDILSGSSGNDTLNGGAGNDTMDGGANSDSMSGGTGDDTYDVNAIADLAVEAAAQGTDLVRSNVNWTLGANIENLIFYSNAGLSGTGNILANTLTGNSGANALSGLDGNDTLVGGAGNDALTGGNGADHFVFNSTTSGVDVIADFNELNGGGEEGDMLRFDGLKVGTFVYLGTGAFSGGSDNTEARVVGNQVLFDANGDGTADITITLTGLTSTSQLAVTDFIFV